MVSIPRIALGAPGIYKYPETQAPPLLGVRMDVAAFVGVAPRGPCRDPILPETWTGDYALVDPLWPRRRSVAAAVESIDEYKRLYGGFEGPGRLPYAVASFFEQGGRKAYIVRIVHDYDDSDANAGGVAAGELVNVITGAGILKLVARNEGNWGNQLKAALGFSVRPVNLLPDPGITELRVDRDEPVPVGSLLRLSLPAAGSSPEEQVLRFVSYVRQRGINGSDEAALYLTLDAPVDRPPDFAEVIQGDLMLNDGRGETERFKNLGLSFLHPRWMATVLFNESRLVYPDNSWVSADIKPLHVSAPPIIPNLDHEDTAHFSGGEDRYDKIIFNDFFDDGWVPGDPEPGDGIYALTRLADLSTVVVPDLYVPEPLPARDETKEEASLAGARFEPCVETAEPAEQTVIATPLLKGLYLDPELPDDLEYITWWQEKLARFADQLQNFVVLLDVPPGLSQKKILRWRARFRSSYVAAYYPWLKVASLEDQRDGLITINPSATAAGIIAKQEIQFGVPHGPANVIAASIVKVDEEVSPVRHNELHPQGINVYLQERDGVRLSAARTLSRDNRYRQLSVRRLMLMLRRALQQQMHWAVFEPNGPSLWSDVRHLLNNFLRRLYAAGAFRGQSEEQAFFVRCDDELNTRRVIDAGQMLAEVGVAPAEPLEFIVLRITRGGDGTLTVED